MQRSVRRWRVAFLPFKTTILVTLMVLLISGSAEGASHVLAGAVYVCLGCSAALLVGGTAAVAHTHDRRLMWSAFGFGLAGLLLASLLWGGAFPTPTKGP
jgi:hypothetical protein